ncbi:MAG TPA: DUF309 domain-containing protein [Candidatus Limnocylindrales bacterium]
MAEGRILQAGRAKAYRPLPLGSRRRAVRAGIAAYRRGDFFEAHELLEPAWMGTQDLAEREALQGLIKLAAAYVHAVRGNPRGVVKNLDGAEARLRRALADGSAPDVGIDIAALVEAIDARRGALPRTAAPSDGRRSDPALAPVILAAVPPPDLVPLR